MKKVIYTTTLAIALLSIAITSKAQVGSSPLSMRVKPHQQIQSTRGTDQNFCFLATSPFRDPPAFTMDNCNNPDGTDCNYSQTDLTINCIDDGGGLGGDLSFDVTISSGSSCTGQIDQTVNGSYSIGTNFTASSQYCQGNGTYDVAITNINWSGLAATLKFGFSIQTKYSCNTNFHGNPVVHCSDVEVDFIFNNPTVTYPSGNPVCPGQQVTITISGLDGQDNQTNHYTFNWLI